MRKIVWLVGMVCGLAGCQCCEVTEYYQDEIDFIADHEGHLDCLYDPRFDLTRIGYPDWCTCRFNQWFCGDRCRCRQQPPDYAHAPVYIAACPEYQPAEIPSQPPQVDPARPGEPTPTPSQENMRPSPESTPQQLQTVPDPKELDPGEREILPPPPLPVPPPPAPGVPQSQGKPVIRPISYQWMEASPRSSVTQTAKYETAEPRPVHRSRTGQTGNAASSAVPRPFPVSDEAMREIGADE